MILDFSPGLPTERLLSILSVPSFAPENVLKIFYIFTFKIWILILLSLITYSMLNYFALNKKECLHTIIDYYGLLVGQG